MHFRTKSVKNFRCMWLLLSCLIAAPLMGQTFTGHVTDTSGAVVQKAAVVVRNQKTNVTTQTLTTGSGDYTVSYLKPGLYNVKVSYQGFKAEEVEGVELVTDQVATLNFRLLPGAVTEVVNVEDGSLVNFAKADQGETVENERVEQLPLNGNNPLMLENYTAGAIWTGYIGYQRPFDDVSQNLSINGGGTGNSPTMIDGVTAESARGNSLVAYVPPVDTVQDFKIVTNPYDASFGRGAGGVIDITLKSGTNQLHGAGYEFMRRDWLDANTWSADYTNATNPSAGIGKPRHWEDQFGGELDGPLYIPHVYNGHNKTFFMIAMEGYRDGEPAVNYQSVPFPQWLTGDFSNATYYAGASKGYQPLIIYDPLTTVTTAGTKLGQRQAFPGNKIPANRINPTALKILSYYTKSNATATAPNNPWTNDQVIRVNATQKYHNASAKIDQNFGNGDHASLRYNWWERYADNDGNGFNNAAENGKHPHAELSHDFAADWVHPFGVNTLLDLKGTVIVRKDYETVGFGTHFDPTQLGWSAQTSRELDGETNFPNMSISGFTGFGYSTPTINIGNSLAIAPNMTMIRGKHNLRFGLDLRLLQEVNKMNPGGTAFSADGGWTQANAETSDGTTGNAIASFLVAGPSSGSFSIPASSYLSRHYYAFWVQDDWKVTPRLTLNLGVRYDLNGPPTDRHNAGNYDFDTSVLSPINAQINQSLLLNGPLKGGLTFLGVNGAPRAYYALEHYDIQPRFGLVYALDATTSVRMGFGEMIANDNQGMQQLGFSSNTSYISSVTGGLTPSGDISNPFPDGIVQPTGSSLGLSTALGGTPSYINPKTKNNKYWQYSVGMEHRFFHQDVFNLAYVGSKTYDTGVSYNVNNLGAAWEAKCDIERGGNHNLCDATSTYVPNPFYHVAAFAGTSLYNGATFSYGTLTRPYPQFANFTEYNNPWGQNWYNSMQAIFTHHWDKNLTLHFSYTWSKLMDEGGYADSVNNIVSRTLDGNDRPHRVTITGVYILPIGRGRQFLRTTNRWVDAAVGGWELAPIYVYETGTPWGAPGEYLHNAWMKPKTTSNGNIVQGVQACTGTRDLNTGAIIPTSFSQGCPEIDFVQRPSYAVTQNVVYSGIRVMPYEQFDLRASKIFTITQRVHFQMSLDAFNALNHPLFQNGWNNSITSASFGTINKASAGQTNLPRQVQLSAKVTW